MTEGENTTLVTLGRSIVPGEPELVTFVWTAIVFAGLLVGVVPALALTTDIAALSLAAIAAVVYLGLLLAAGAVFEGLAAAGLVLAIFNTSLFAVTGVPGVGSLRLVAGDVVVVPLLVVLLYDRWRAVIPRRVAAVVVASGGLVVFVVWSFLAVVFGHGVSDLAALAFATEQLRYLLVFAFAALIADRTGPRCVLYPLLISIAANVGFSLAQIANGGVFGLATLGETANRYLGDTVHLAGASLRTGFYAGGFVGNGREFALIGLLFVPVVLGAGLSGRWRYLPVSIVAAAAAVLTIRIANTDGGWAALLGALVLFGLYLVYAVVAGVVGRAVRRRYAVATGVGVAGLVGLGVVGLLYHAATALDTGSRVLIFSTSSLSIRLDEYVLALRVAYTYPLFGLGGDNFLLMSTSFGLPSPFGVHNTLLSNLAATGIVGFLAYLLSLLAVFWLVARRIVSVGERERVLWVGMLCGLLAFWAYASLSTAYTWTSANAAFWVVAGAVVGAWMRPKSVRVLNHAKGTLGRRLS